MKRFRSLAAAVLLAVSATAPVTLRADWVVVDYDMQTDWVNYDFVGWVRVEQALTADRYGRGNAAVQLTVVEKLIGDGNPRALALEYTAPIKPTHGVAAPDLPPTRNWGNDIASHAEHFVFLQRLPNGGYWCDDLRVFPIVDGTISGLPKTYEAVLGEGVTPNAREFFNRARGTVPALRARVGRPGFMPPLIEQGRPAATPGESLQPVLAAVRENKVRDLDRSIHSVDGSSPKTFRKWLLDQREQFTAPEVRWQAVLDDKAVVQLAPPAPGQPGATFYLLRRGPRWSLLNTQPDNEAGARAVAAFVTEQYAVLNALLIRDNPTLAERN